MSEPYLVSARKYRPQTFDTVVGQEHITTTLKNAIRHQQLAHAYLFCGPRGVGKTTCARILAKTINCESPTEDMEACGVCPTCVAFESHSSFNVFELDAASNNSVDDIRELVNQVRFAPQQGRYKIYIIDEVHMLSAAAFNAFLKTLEEPPPYAIFILATTEKHKILPTILSRCQIFDFKRIKTADTVAHLNGIAGKEGLHTEEAALHLIAQKSEGCMRDALSMLDRISSFTEGGITYALTLEHLSMLDAAFYFRLTDALLAVDVPVALLAFEEVLARGFEGDAVLNGLAEHFRSLLLCKDERMARLLDVPAEHRSLFYHKAQQAPPAFLMSALSLLNTAELDYRNATNKRLHVEVALIRLAHLSLPAPGDPLQKKSPDGESAFIAPVIPPAEPVAAPEVVAVPPVAAALSTPAPVKNLTPLPAEPTPTPASIAPPVAAVVQQKTAAPVAGAVPETSVSQKGAFQPAPAITAVEAPPMPEQQPGRPARRRVSFEMLEELEKTVVAEAPPLPPFTSTEAVAVLASFNAHLKETGASVLLAQFIFVTAEMGAEDEVKIICPNAYVEASVRGQRDKLLDFFKEKSGRALRVTTEIREDESLPKPERQLSRQETFQKWTEEYPLLGALKDRLRLQLDF